jgi:hypothetical protein
MTAGGNGRLTIFQSAAIDDQRLGNAAFRVLAALGSYADANGVCFPSQATIAGRLKVSRQAVAKCLAQLESLGYIAVTHQFGPNGAKRNSLYRLNFAIAAPTQPDVASPTQPEVAETQPQVAPTQPQKLLPTQPITLHPTQPEVATHATSEVAYNVPSNDPIVTTHKNDPKKVTSLPRARRPADDVWDAVEEVVGWTPTTKPERDRFGRVVTTLLGHNATGDEVRRRGGNYRATWPHLDLTPEALVKHWSRFDHGPARASPGVNGVEPSQRQQRGAVALQASRKLTGG